MHFKSKYGILIISAFILACFADGCDTATEPVKAERVIKGMVRDSVSGAGVDGVTVSAVPFIANAYTDTSGSFEMTGVGAGTYTLTFRKQGYITNRITVSAGNDTAKVDAKILFANLYIYTNRTLTEFYNSSSLSAINLLTGDVVNESGTQYDMQLRDSAGTGNNYHLRSGDLALLTAGYQTKFSARLINPLNSSYTFTKQQFDTLSKYYTPDGNIDPARDFTSDRTPSFNETPNMPNNVYAFWLSGRNTSPPVYGMFFLNYSYRDTMAQSRFKLVIDVKVNKGGLNIFNPNN